MESPFSDCDCDKQSNRKLPKHSQYKILIYSACNRATTSNRIPVKLKSLIVKNWLRVDEQYLVRQFQLIIWLLFCLLKSRIIVTLFKLSKILSNDQRNLSRMIIYCATQKFTTHSTELILKCNSTK